MHELSYFLKGRWLVTPKDPSQQTLVDEMTSEQINQFGRSLIDLGRLLTSGLHGLVNETELYKYLSVELNEIHMRSFAVALSQLGSLLVEENGATQLAQDSTPVAKSTLRITTTTALADGSTTPYLPMLYERMPGAYIRITPEQVRTALHRLGDCLNATEAVQSGLVNNSDGRNSSFRQVGVGLLQSFFVDRVGDTTRVIGKAFHDLADLLVKRSHGLFVIPYALIVSAGMAHRQVRRLGKALQDLGQLLLGNSAASGYMHLYKFLSTELKGIPLDALAEALDAIGNVTSQESDKWPQSFIDYLNAQISLKGKTTSSLIEEMAWRMDQAAQVEQQPISPPLLTLRKVDSVRVDSINSDSGPYA